MSQCNPLYHQNRKLKLESYCTAHLHSRMDLSNNSDMKMANTRMASSTMTAAASAPTIRGLRKTKLSVWMATMLTRLKKC